MSFIVHDAAYCVTALTLTASVCARTRLITPSDEFFLDISLADLCPKYLCPIYEGRQNNTLSLHDDTATQDPRVHRVAKACVILNVSNMAKRILITGASGLLGRDCMTTFSKDPEWTTLGLAFSRAGQNLRKVDLTDPGQVTEVIKEFKPSVILHSAAERRPDVVEKEEEKTRNINVGATKQLCDLANEIGAYVLFISTDYVFDGTQPPYKPTDKPNPLNKYGASKAEGERVVMDSSSGNIVLRVPILYGIVEKLDESAVTVLFSKVKDTSKPAEMNHCERRYPTSCSDVAEAIKVLTENRIKNPDITGAFHWSGTEMMTKYDMAVAMAESFGISTSHIIADTKPASGAPRPFDCHLDCSRLEELGASKTTPFREGIKPALEKFYP